MGLGNTINKSETSLDQHQWLNFSSLLRPLEPGHGGTCSRWRLPTLTVTRGWRGPDTAAAAWTRTQSWDGSSRAPAPGPGGHLPPWTLLSVVCWIWISTSASKSSIRRFVMTEKAPTRAYSWLKAPTSAFTFETLLRHYAKQVLTNLPLV